MKADLDEFTEDISDNEDEDEDLFPGYICDCKHCLHCLKITYCQQFYDMLNLPDINESKYFSCQECYGILRPLSALLYEDEVKKNGLPKCPTCNDEIEKRALGIYTYNLDPDTAFDLLKDDFRFGCKGKSDQEIIDDICYCYYCEKCCDSQDYIDDETCNKCGKNNMVLFYLEKHFHRKKDTKVEQLLESIRKNNELLQCHL
jgi:hypothetical protein